MNPKILIVGSGASGFAAGTKLLENGFKNVTILEAENRIGGRVCTIPFSKNVVDMGAQWCHGEKDNVVFELSNKFKVFDSATTKYDKFLFIRSNGEYIKDEIGDKLMTIAISLVEDYKDELKTYQGSLGSFIIEKYNKVVAEHKDIDSLVSQQFIEFFHKYENSIEASDNWFDTSAEGYLHYWDCDGDRLLNWKDKGYGFLFNILQKSFPDPTEKLPIIEKILFNKTVSNIDWNCDDSSKNKFVKVKCTDGSSYEADHVICTVSLGVLKEKHLQIFNPKLPVLKKNAIDGLTLGTVDKIFLEFKEPFWPKDWLGFSLLWNDEDLEVIRKMKHNWMEDIFGFYAVDFQPNILCGWISGKNARIMEETPENEVIETVMFLMRKFLVKFNVPDPIRMERSTWYKNPNFRGSYSYRSINTDLLNTTAEHLAFPLTNSIGVPVLQFAGEATHENYYSTVHGAVESGWREAKRITDFYKKIENPNHYNVIILGAGMAGLGAATNIKKNSKKSFLILEAQEEPGGRVSTKYLKIFRNEKINEKPNMLIDTGAQWLHGKFNYLHEIAEKSNLISPVLSEEGIGDYLTEDGKKIDDFFVKKVDFVIGEILEECEKYAKEDCFENYPRSVEHFLREKFNIFYENLKTLKEKEAALKLLDWHIRFQIIDNSCLSFKDVSAKYWGKYSLNGESCQTHINIKNGFSSLIKILESEIGKENISYNKEIIEIIYGDSKILIKCSDDSEYTANHLITTFSVGVLKEKHKSIFKPELTEKFTQIIKDLGFETINKIFLKFESRWWVDREGFQLLWNDEDYRKCDWVRYITGFDVIEPDTLLAWVGGRGAVEMEKLKDQQIVIDCIELLKKFTKMQVPDPISYYCSKWNSNKFIRGGYSFTSRKCDNNKSFNGILSEPIYRKDIKIDNITQLASELNISSKNENHNKELPIFYNYLNPDFPILLFAGEACHDKYFSTAHGAFLSGMEQSSKILKFYK